MKNKLTYRNKLAICLSAFYAIISLFVALCLDASHAIMTRNNPIELIGDLLGFQDITPSAATWALVVLFLAYVIVYTYVVCVIANYLKGNGEKAYSAKAFLYYVVALIACLALSIGVGTLFHLPIDDVADYVATLTYLYQSATLGLLIFLVVAVFAFAVIGTILYAIRSYHMKDSEAAKEDKAEEAGEEEIDEKADLANSFDSLNEGKEGKVGVAGGVATGQAGVATGGTLVSLGKKEEVFRSLAAIDEKETINGTFPVEGTPLSLAEIVRRLQIYLANTWHLYYNLRELALFIASFSATHLIILEGISGTGKSSLPRYFAEFISEDAFFQPVQMTFREKSDLLGYYNEFTGKYMETDFLKKLYEATYRHDEINIMVLDEMNISRVEYYFADFLSVLEFPEDERKITLLQLPENYDGPEHLKNGVLDITLNTFFVGTCNQDDSTYTITDKVVDRAVVISFDNYQQELSFDEEVTPINLTYDGLHQLFEEASSVEENRFNETDRHKFYELLSFVDDEFSITIGNRIINQIETMTPVYIALGRSKEELVDFFFATKVLRKLNGRFDSSLVSSLKKLTRKIDELYSSNNFELSREVMKKLSRRVG